MFTNWAIVSGLLGLAFVYINGLSGLFQYMVRQSALVETYMTSVERLLYYSRRVVREEDDPTAEEKSDVNVLVTPDSSWPSSGTCNSVCDGCARSLPWYRHNGNASVPPLLLPYRTLPNLTESNQRKPTYPDVYGMCIWLTEFSGQFHDPTQL